MIQKTIKIFGKELTLSMRNDGDQAVANEVFRDRDYAFCDDAIKKAQHAVIDIGGHAGFFSLYASTLNPTVPIYSFEPHAGNYQLLKQNLKQNRVKNFFPKNLAIWHQVTQMELRISQEDLNHSLIHAIEDDGERQNVGTTTLEKVILKNKLEKVDLLKMDCEGAESEILLNTHSSIFDKVSTIFLEYHDWVPGVDHRELKRFLEKRGYTVRDFPNHKMQELGFLWAHT